jgi:hypothetical protein
MLSMWNELRLKATLACRDIPPDIIVYAVEEASKAESTRKQKIDIAIQEEIIRTKILKHPKKIPISKLECISKL